MAAALAGAEPEAPQGPGRVQMDDALFKRMDANGDGVVTREEFDASNARRFQEMDANNDGKVTREEMDVRVNQAMRNGLRHFEERFSSADLNRDGVLDRVEAQAMPVMEVFFDQVDANKDGKVTREEYFAAMPMLHKAKNIGPKGKDSAL
jgi:Ca2+-binding EF-hand superfamily protein